jgi:DNA-binding MarR family transcriptional regulator
MRSVNALELFLLGRKLMKLGEEAMPPSGVAQMVPSIRSVMADIFEHPGSSISEITERTGFPQSHVSVSVARLRDVGALLTAPDPADRRRTLVRPNPRIVPKAVQFAGTPIEETVARALGTDSTEDLADVLAALEVLGRLITPGDHRPARSEPEQAERAYPTAAADRLASGESAEMRRVGRRRPPQWANED